MKTSCEYFVTHVLTRIYVTYIGGVVICVANKDANAALNDSDGEEGNEYIITGQSLFQIPVHIMSFYGEI